jgi:hypothetical protein
MKGIFPRDNPGEHRNWSFASGAFGRPRTEKGPGPAAQRPACQMKMVSCDYAYYTAAPSTGRQPIRSGRPVLVEGADGD